MPELIEYQWIKRQTAQKSEIFRATQTLVLKNRSLETAEAKKNKLNIHRYKTSKNRTEKSAD